MNPDEQISELQAQVARLRDAHMRQEFAAALTAAKCRPEGMADALVVLLGTSRAEYDAEDRIAQITIGSETYDSLSAAAEAYMASRPHMLDAPRDPVKVGQRGPTADALVSEGLARPIAPPSPAARTKAPPAQPISLDDMINSGQHPGELAAAGWLSPPK